MANVRELLELERNLYQESIIRNERELKELEKGELLSYQTQCVPFQKARDEALRVAKVHRQYMQRNLMDILEYQIKSAQDIYHSALQKSKVQPQTFSENDVQEDRSSNDDAFDIPSLLTPENIELLTEKWESLLSKVNKAFDMRHFSPCLLSPQERAHQMYQIKAHVDAYKKRRESGMKSSVSLTNSNPPRLTIDSETFSVGQQIVLYSQLCESDFMGTIIALRNDAMQIRLLCDSIANVPYKHLQTQECRLYHNTLESQRD